MADAVLAARYPFLPEASALVADQGPDLETLTTGAAWAAARRRGRDRLVGAVTDGEIARQSLPTSTSRPEYVAELFEETVSYGVARILCSVLDDGYIVRRHALAEAVRVKKYLDGEEPDIVLKVGQALKMGVDAADEVAEDGSPLFTLHFTDFLRFATTLKDTRWKLSSQALAGGVVTLAQPKLARLCQEALRRRIESELPRQVAPAVKKALKADVAVVKVAARERQELMQAEAFGEVDLDLLPPCQKHILAMLQRGENAAHTARFAITSFLHAIGLDSEEIMKLFAQAPDFREDMTRYQVEHITGKNSPTEYSPPGCQAMKSNGICYNEDNWCRSIRLPEKERIVNHPLTYYKWMYRRKGRGLGAVPPAAPREYEPREPAGTKPQGARASK